MNDQITLRFVSHGGIFGWLCRIAQLWFWATHVETILPNGLHVGSRFLNGGVRIEAQDYDKGEFSQELVVNLKATAAQIEAFYTFIREQVGKPYDWRAIVSFIVSYDWQEPDSWDCAELIAAALIAAGLFPQHLAVKTSRMTVEGVYLMASMIAEGA